MWQLTKHWRVEEPELLQMLQASVIASPLRWEGACTRWGSAHSAAA